MNLDQYLKKLQRSESMFPIDSFGPSRKVNKKVLEEIEIEETPNMLIDFDGTIHKYSKGWDDGSIYDPPISGAKEAIDKLKETYKIVIFTTRVSPSANKDYLEQTKNIELWMKKYNIYFDEITSEKIPAFRMIDDLAIKFDGDWNKTIEEIKKAELEQEEV